MSGNNWQVLSVFAYHWLRNDRILTVPAGYITDQASIPSFILPIIVSRTGDISMAAVPHDYGYTDLDHGDWKKSEVDMLFRDAMIEAGVPRWRAYIAWAGVRLNIMAAYKW